jgi:hypothetical protein
MSIAGTALKQQSAQTRSFLRRGVSSYPRVSAHTLLRGPPGAYARALLPYQSYVIQLESDRPTRIISPETSHRTHNTETHTVCNVHIAQSQVMCAYFGDRVQAA